MYIYTAIVIPFVLMILALATALYLAADIARTVHNSGDILCTDDHYRFERATRLVRTIIFCVSMVTLAFHFGWMVVWGNLHFGWLIASIIICNTAYGAFDITYEELSDHWMYKKSGFALVVLFNKTTTPLWLLAIALAPLGWIFSMLANGDSRGNLYDREIYRLYFKQ